MLHVFKLKPEDQADKRGLLELYRSEVSALSRSILPSQMVFHASVLAKIRARLENVGVREEELALQRRLGIDRARASSERR